ncbi:HAD family hydrolase [archaeon]|nr:MAG: HAD family hydrolase [archaeon]
MTLLALLESKRPLMALLVFCCTASINAGVLGRWIDVFTLLLVLSCYIMFGMAQTDSKKYGQVSSCYYLALALSLLSMVLSFVLVCMLINAGEDVKDILSLINALIVLAGIPLTIDTIFFCMLSLGSQALAKEGIIVTHLSAIDNVANINVLCVDMVGTLTMNKLTVQPDDTVLYDPNVSHASLLAHAAMTIQWNSSAFGSAIDTVILNAVDINQIMLGIEQCQCSSDDVLKRSEATLLNKSTGSIFMIAKGLPKSITALVKSEDVIRQCDYDVTRLEHKGYRAVAVAKTDESKQWHLLGILSFLDPPFPDTKIAVKQLRLAGVEVKMLTGDQVYRAEALGCRIELNDNSTGRPLITSPQDDPFWDDQQLASTTVKRNGELIRRSHGFANLFPQQKAMLVECLGAMGYNVGVTGDGLQHILSFSSAFVSIAVAGATDGVREAADVVLTRQGLQPIAQGIHMSKGLMQRLQYALPALVLFYCLVFFEAC